MDSAPGDVTRLLIEHRNGNKNALDELIPIVYDELRAIAARHMRRERAEHTLEPTALVNEAYFRLVDQTRAEWNGRSHFLAVASQAMRRLLIDHARGRGREKRGGELYRVDLDDALERAATFDSEILAVHEALERLAKLDERQAKVVELRYFGGLAADEVAETLGLSKRTVEAEWTHAKAWLLRELSREAGS
jgi:RNA polymerase sigma factor (TIGR02999 family)